MHIKDRHIDIEDTIPGL